MICLKVETDDLIISLPMKQKADQNDPEYRRHHVIWRRRQLIMSVMRFSTLLLHLISKIKLIRKYNI